MPVGEMLRRTSSKELTEWQAYEKEYGILGPSYDREMLRLIHFQQQQFLFQWGASKVEQGKQPPFPEPKLVPGPADFEYEDEDEE